MGVQFDSHLLRMCVIFFFPFLAMVGPGFDQVQEISRIISALFFLYSPTTNRKCVERLTTLRIGCKGLRNVVT